MNATLYCVTIKGKRVIQITCIYGGNGGWLSKGTWPSSLNFQWGGWTDKVKMRASAQFCCDFLGEEDTWEKRMYYVTKFDLTCCLLLMSGKAVKRLIGSYI